MIGHLYDVLDANKLPYKSNGTISDLENNMYDLKNELETLETKNSRLEQLQILQEELR